MSLSARAEKVTGPDPNFFLIKVLANEWHPETNPLGYINLGVAENSLLHDRFLKYISALLERNGAISEVALTYGDGCQRLKRAVARSLNRRMHPSRETSPDDIFVSNGCTVAIENISWAVANPCDAILLGRPFYGAFPANVSKRTGIDLQPVSFGRDIDPMSLKAVGMHQAAILHAKSCGQRVAAIILANPHNPLGRCYPRNGLLAYMRLCQEYHVHLIGDEICALSAFHNTIDIEPASAPFESLLSINKAGIIDEDLVHVIWGMSKDFGASGLRMGFIITQSNAPLKSSLQNIFEFAWTSSLSDLVTATVLEDGIWVDKFIQDNCQLLGRHHAMVLRWAMDNGIEYAPGSSAGFFVWVNLGDAYRRNRTHCCTPVEEIDGL